jgi:hypothetical protein
MKGIAVYALTEGKEEDTFFVQMLNDGRLYLHWKRINGSWYN